MSIIGRITQQPSDRIDYDIDCSDLCLGGDSIATNGVTVSAAVKSAPSGVTPAALTVTGLKSSATKAKAWISGGTDGVTYEVEITVSTNGGRTKQDELIVKVKEI